MIKKQLPTCVNLNINQIRFVYLQPLIDHFGASHLMRPSRYVYFLNGSVRSAQLLKCTIKLRNKKKIHEMKNLPTDRITWLKPMTPNKRRSAFNAWPGSSCRVLWQDMHFTPTAPLSTLQVSSWGSPEMDYPPIQEGGGG